MWRELYEPGSEAKWQILSTQTKGLRRVLNP